MLKVLLLYWRTIRSLKSTQIFYRIWYKFYKSCVNQVSLPQVQTTPSLFTRPAMTNPSMCAPQVWEFLNERGELNLIGWDGPIRNKLWRYNQHYFDDLNAAGASGRTEWHYDLIERWLDENSPFSGVAWEPYPTSLRIVNWIKWSSQGYHLNSKAQKSLALQARFLASRLELHLLGNHLFSNAKALVYAGLYFQGDEADLWLNTGMRILENEINEQILDDGGQFELSPMYHALATVDVLDLVNICRANKDRLCKISLVFVKTLEKKIDKMLNWLVHLSHPDGKISFFNDAAFEIAPENIEIFSYALRLGFEVKMPPLGVTELPNSGFVRLETDEAVLLFNAAEMGPTYLPGHSHADSLSIELSVAKQRILVNSGTSTYDIGAERLRQRGTAAHNTVCINDCNSSEVWSSFRVGRRARIIEKRSLKTEQCLSAMAIHSGYSRIFKKRRHKRSIFLAKDNMIVRDEVSHPEISKVYYYFHPDTLPQIINNLSGEIILKSGKPLRWKFEGVNCVRLLDTTWHPKFGTSVKNNCLEATLENRICEFTLVW